MFNTDNKAILITFLLVGFALASVNAQKLVYRVDYKNDSIGYMTAEKKLSNSKTIYELKTYTKFRIVLSFNHYEYYKSEYQDDLMLISQSESYLNDKARSKTTVKRSGSGYVIVKDDETSKGVNPINESITSLYFKEPSSGNIFSEKHGEFCSIQKVATGKYALAMPDDRKNIYEFKNGICDKVEINMSLATVYLTRIK